MRLTPLAKILIVFTLTGLFALAYAKRNSLLSRLGAGAGAAGSERPTAAGDPPVQHTETTAPGSAGASASPRAGKRPHIVVGVNDFGGAYAGLVANDGATAGPRSLFTQAGLDVEIKLVRGSKERLEQFDQGKVDVMLLTLDYVANLYANYKHDKNVDLQAFFFVDWSRGNLGIVSKPGFDSIEALKSARIATTRETPTHYLTLTLLERSSLTPNEITAIKGNLVFVKKTPDAAELFKRGEIDAAAIWEPHLSRAVHEGKGKLLISTHTATNLIADVLFARKNFLDEHSAVMPAFIRAWLAGEKRMAENREAAIALISQAFAQTADETRDTMSKVKPATFADNRAFFGLETENSAFASLLEEAGGIWKREGVIADVPQAKQVARTGFLEQIRDEYKSETVLEDWKFERAKASGPALLSKSASIYFDTGSDQLDASARSIVDRFSEGLVGVFQNAYVRIEGNTDSTGVSKLNAALSKRRAEAVVNYLVTRFRFDPARFVAVGNGASRPVGDNSTDHGRELNRRTDFRIVPNY